MKLSYYAYLWGCFISILGLIYVIRAYRNRNKIESMPSYGDYLNRGQSLTLVLILMFLTGLYRVHLPTFD